METDGRPPKKLAEESSVKMALSLYKVQQNIFLLDFQRIEVTNYICIVIVVSRRLLMFA